MHEYGGKGRPGSPSEQQARREEQGWADRPHEDLVRAFRGLIWKGRQDILQEGRKTDSLTPAIMIKGELLKQTGLHMSPDPLDKQRAVFFQPIKDAWDAVAYEHYRREGTGQPTYDRVDAGIALSATYGRAKARHEPRPEFLQLDPQQVRILDALAEAAGVPHQRGQTEIEIPEHVRDYEQRLRPRGK